jgi:hypothetical protein
MNPLALSDLDGAGCIQSIQPIGVFLPYSGIDARPMQQAAAALKMLG